MAPQSSTLATRKRFLFLIFLFFVIVLSIIAPLADKVEDQNHAADPAKYAVIKENFADPCLVADVDGKYYAFATGNATIGINIQVASAISTNLSHWTMHRDQDALPTLGSWALQPSKVAEVWAPEVVQRPDGNWVMYYTALHHEHSRKHCIGAATSTVVTGPYRPLNTTLACDFDKGGAIDPAFFTDPLSGNSYLIYKDDGNAIGHGGACSNSVPPIAPTPLRVQQVDPRDLVTPVGAATYLLNSFPDDGPNIEGPQMWFVNDPQPQYHLVYNSGCYHDETYKLKHIICLAGPPAGSTWELCSWQLAESLQIFIDDDRQSWRMGDLLRTGHQLVPGQKDSKVYAPGGAAVGAQGRVMAFHADLNLKFFKDPATESRVRGMFITELGYVWLKDGLQIGDLKYQGS